MYPMSLNNPGVAEIVAGALGVLMPYGQGTVYNTELGKYQIAGDPRTFDDPHQLQEALYAEELKQLREQEPSETSVVVGPFPETSELFRTLPDGTTISETAYQQALREGKLPELVHYYTGAGGAVPIPQGTFLLGAAGSNAIAAGGTMTVSAKLTNTTRGGTDFQVGDEWLVEITGLAGSPVVASATQNAGAVSTTTMGSIPANGRWVKTGRMSEAELGDWWESWSVGGEVAGVFTFKVVRPTAATGGGARAGNGAKPGEEEKPSGFDITSLLQGELVAGIPNWVLGAAAVGGYLLLKGKGGR